MSEKNENVCVVVVTYNRLSTLKSNLKCIFEQTAKIQRIVVINNNSTDGTFEYLQEVEKNHDNVVVNNLTQNIGGAGGFSTGIEMASKYDDIDYVWGMDDDAYPNKDALKELLVYAKKDRCLWSNCNDDSDFDDDYKEVKQWMFVGFFIPVEIIKEIGLPRKDFFIYHDDAEYSKRIILHGYKILKIKNSIIIHQDTPNKNKMHKKVLFWNCEFDKLPDWKFYYFVRNSILMYSWKEPYKYKLIIWFITKYFLKLLIFSPKQIGIFLKAYIHGILNKSGIYVMP